jgi:hypothetical protein
MITGKEGILEEIIEWENQGLGIEIKTHTRGMKDLEIETTNAVKDDEAIEVFILVN